MTGRYLSGGQLMLPMFILLYQAKITNIVRKQKHKYIQRIYILSHHSNKNTTLRMLYKNNLLYFLLTIKIDNY